MKDAGGYLFDKVKNKLIPKISNYFSGSLGGNKQSLGKSVMDRMYDMGQNAFGGIKKFANSDYLQRKVPILAPIASDAANYFSDRLDRGYNAIMGGNKGGAGAGGGGPGPAAGGIERMQM